MKRLLLMLALVATSVHADENWVHIESTLDGNDSYDFKAGECLFVRRTAGVSYERCLERHVDHRAHSSEFEFVEVEVIACTRGYGILSHFDFHFNLLYQNDVTSNGGTIGSAEFDFICAIVNMPNT